ncbi:hypothetical protein [Lachnoclostridium sp.]|uniref:hypothetical protein n=1 Tax=Lachnoclostridium sp. TaxID=2028282 RepID=UPI00289C8BA2|nr:hypothetical protein [Lachnoclostridium sp.]
MKKFNTAFAVIIILLITLGISWGLVVGLIKLITLCFGISFKLSYATGVWLIILLVKQMLCKKDK